jgi:hypothetical protein
MDSNVVANRFNSARTQTAQKKAVKKSRSYARQDNELEASIDSTNRDIDPFAVEQQFPIVQEYDQQSVDSSGTTEEETYEIKQ